MCEPTTLAAASMAIGAGKSVVGFMAGEADYDAKMAAYNQNVVNSEAAARDNYKAILQQQLQEQGKTIQKEHISNLEEAQKRATVEVSAAGGGVGGISVDNILQDISAKSLENRTYADTNYRWVAQQTQAQLTGTTNQEKARIGSMPVPIAPNPLGMFLGIGEAGVKGYKDFTSGKNATSTGD